MSFERGMAQLVARTAGGREVASSSLVTPTKRYFTISFKQVICEVAARLRRISDEQVQSLRP